MSPLAVTLPTGEVLVAAGSPSPAPTDTSVTPGFGPTQQTTGDVGASAGGYAFGLVVGLILVSIVIFVAMNRSLKRVRHNLGSSVLPRREADRLPVAPKDGSDPH